MKHVTNADMYILIMLGEKETTDQCAVLTHPYEEMFKAGLLLAQGLWKEL